jgi:hypothetical protein
MEKFFYFRDVVDEANDLTSSNSLTIPVRNITGIAPNTDNESLYIYFKSPDNQYVNQYVDLTVKRGMLKEVMGQLVRSMNAGPHNDGFIVIADACVTTDGATSIQGNNIAVPSKFFSSDITAVAI